MYKIIRMYSRLPSLGEGEHLLTKHRTIHRDLSLDQAQAHCRDSKTSSKVAGKKNGWEWFDGYEEQ